MVHGIMFHHFHSGSHPKRPGSISAKEFDEMIIFLQKRFDILSPNEFEGRLLAGKLRDHETVLTFDDGLQSQLDIALPVLEAHEIQGLFSVYTSVFSREPDPLEIFGAYRSDFFESFVDFWGHFQSHLEDREPQVLESLGTNYPEDYLSLFPFYVREERQFRFVRDEILGPKRYQELMWVLISDTPGFDLDEVISSLWVTCEGLAHVVSRDHSIGLHSHTHPTRMDLLSLEAQAKEYETNKNWIEAELGVVPRFVAHPCGQYSRETLEILKELNVSVGFRSTLSDGPFGTLLEIPREDHANIHRKMVSS